MLENQQSVFSLKIWENGEEIDGPYIAFSIGEAQKAIRKYLEEWEEDEEWKNAYWSIDQYCRDNVKESDIFALPKYTYIAKCNGDIQYFKHRSNKKPRNFEERYKLLVEENFGMRSVDLNIPVPYCPGDILKIEYSPYIFEFFL